MILYPNGVMPMHNDSIGFFIIFTFCAIFSCLIFHHSLCACVRIHIFPSRYSPSSTCEIRFLRLSFCLCCKMNIGKTHQHLYELHIASTTIVNSERSEEFFFSQQQCYEAKIKEKKNKYEKKPWRFLFHFFFFSFFLIFHRRSPSPVHGNMKNATKMLFSVLSWLSCSTLNTVKTKLDYCLLL